MAEVNTSDRDYVKLHRPTVYALPKERGWVAFDSAIGHRPIAGPFHAFEDVWHELADQVRIDLRRKTIHNLKRKPFRTARDSDLHG